MGNLESGSPFLKGGNVTLAKRNYYKPWALKTPALAMLLFLTLSLSGMTEFALHALPSSSSHGIVEERTTRSSLSKRQSDNFTSTVTTRVHGTLETLAITYQDPCPPGDDCAPAPQYWLAVGTVTLHPQQTPPPNATSGSPPLIYVFTQKTYFVGAFLSTLIAVLFSLPWIIIDSKIRALEPFHQLSKDRGAEARKSLGMDYFYPFAIVAPIKALFSGHWAPLLTSLLSICTLLITPVAPEFVSVRMQGSCDSQAEGCVPSLSIFPAAGRAVEGLLCFMAILTILLLIYLSRYSTGVFAEPSSIAGLATLFHNPEVMEDFRNALGAVSRNRSFDSLRKRRYKVDFYTDRDRIQKYGLVPLAPSMSMPANIQAEQPCDYQVPRGSFPERNISFNRPHWKGALGLIVLLSGLVTTIIYYKLTDNPGGFERFMDSQGFGVRFLFTSIGVIIKLYWSSIFRDISNLEPFQNLAKRSSEAQDSILIAKHSSTITAFLSALTRRHFLVAFVALSAFLADALTVCLSNIHFKSGTTFEAFTVVTWLSCSIIVVMLVTLVGVSFRREPDLPLKPTTLAVTLCYLSSSSIPGRLSSMTRLSGGVRNRVVRNFDLKYGMWIQGGVPTIGVEAFDP